MSDDQQRSQPDWPAGLPGGSRNQPPIPPIRLQLRPQSTATRAASPSSVSPSPPPPPPPPPPSAPSPPGLRERDTNALGPRPAKRQRTEVNQDPATAQALATGAQTHGDESIDFEVPMSYQTQYCDPPLKLVKGARITANLIYQADSAIQTAQKKVTALQAVMNDEGLQHARPDLVTKQDKEKKAFLEAMAVKQMVMPRMPAMTTLELTLKQEFLEVKKAIADQGKAIADQGKAIADQGKAIAEQGKAIAEQSKAIAEQSKAIAEQSKAIAEQSKAIAKLQTTVTTIKEQVDKTQTVNTNLLAAAIFQQVQAAHRKNDQIVKNYKALTMARIDQDKQKYALAAELSIPHPGALEQVLARVPEAAGGDAVLFPDELGFTKTEHEAMVPISFADLFPRSIAKVRAMNVHQVKQLGAYYGRQFYEVQAQRDEGARALELQDALLDYLSGV